MVSTNVVIGKRLLKNIAAAQQAEEDQEEARVGKEVERRKKYGTKADRDKAAKHLEQVGILFEERAPAKRELIEKTAFELQELESNVTTAAQRVAAFDAARESLKAVAPLELLEARKLELRRVEKEHARIHQIEGRLDQIASIMNCTDPTQKMLHVRANHFDEMILKDHEKTSQWTIKPEAWAEYLTRLRNERAELEPELQQLHESRQQAQEAADAELNAWIENVDHG